MERSYW